MDSQTRTSGHPKIRQKKGSILTQLLLVAVGACFLTAFLSAFMYYFFGLRTLAREMTDEMIPRARGIARLSSRYLEGKIGNDSYSFFVINERMEESRAYIYDSQGNMIARSFNRFDNEETEQDYSAYVLRVLRGDDPVRETDFRRIDGILVGVPISDNMNRVSGVVIVTKQANQLKMAMLSMTGTLLISSCIISALLTLVIYILNKKLTDPIKRMTRISEQMAAGDFSAIADENASGEVGQLGAALNFLSGELSQTINDLMSVRDRLTKILSGMSEGIVAVDDSFLNITFMNNSAEKMLFHPKPFAFSEDEKDRYLDCCRNALAQKTSERMILKRDDRRILLNITGIEDTSGDSTRLIILLQDVTEAERLEQTRRDYVANVSHELRTPIASIRSLAETLVDGMVKTEEDKARYYEYILRESLRLSRLINDLLELSRIQSGSLALSKQNFDLNHMLADVYDRMRLTAQESDMELEYEEASLGDVYSNPDRIEQVVVALLDNAIKYASDNGKIRIVAENHDDYVAVEVRNTGHIDDADMPHLFERFYKADKSHTGMGTGLGLAIAYEVLKMLGEDIQARNENGEAVFRFTIHRQQTA